MIASLWLHPAMMAWHLTCRGQWTTCQPRSYDSKILYLWQMIATLPYPIPATNILGIKRQNLRTDIIWAWVTWLLPGQLQHPLFPCPGWEETTHHSPLTTQCSGHWSHWSLVPEQQILSSDPTLCQLCQQYAEHRKHWTFDHIQCHWLI